jgi:hypothetical protein
MAKTVWTEEAERSWPSTRGTWTARLASLRETDRKAVLLRFYEHKTLRRDRRDPRDRRGRRAQARQPRRREAPRLLRRQHAHAAGDDVVVLPLQQARHAGADGAGQIRSTAAAVSPATARQRRRDRDGRSRRFAHVDRAGEVGAGVASPPPRVFCIATARSSSVFCSRRRPDSKRRRCALEPSGTFRGNACLITVQRMPRPPSTHACSSTKCSTTPSDGRASDVHLEPTH